MVRKEETNEELNQKARSEWRRDYNRRKFEELMKWEAKQREKKEGGKVSHKKMKYGMFDNSTIRRLG